MERVHRMRAIRCEREVLERLLTIEQVRTARIDTEQSTIEYLSFDGTTDGPQSFPMGSKVGDIVLGLGWSCAEVLDVYGEELDPTSNASGYNTVLVTENTRILELPVAQELAASMQMGLEISELFAKCRHLADIETRIAARIRERTDFLSCGAAEYLPNKRTIDFKKNMLFKIRMAFLSCSAALHLHRGGHESDLGEFWALLREFKPDNRASGEWMTVMLNAFQKAAIFPSTREYNFSRKRQRRSELLSSCSSDSDAA